MEKWPFWGEKVSHHQVPGGKWAGSLKNKRDVQTKLFEPIRSLLWICVCVQPLSQVPLFCDPTDCILLGSSVHETFQARILELVAILFSRGSSQTRDQTQVSCIAGGFFNIWATREALKDYSKDILILRTLLGSPGHLRTSRHGHYNTATVIQLWDSNGYCSGELASFRDSSFGEGGSLPHKGLGEFSLPQFSCHALHFVCQQWLQKHGLITTKLNYHLRLYHLKWLLN